MDSHDVEIYFRQHRRLLVVLSLVIGMAAVSGVFVGMRQTAEGTSLNAVKESMPMEATTAETPRAPKYSEIREAGWLSNDEWKYSLQQLAKIQDAREPSTKLMEEELATVLSTRASRRAFDGAPPTVPHEIHHTSSASCVVCHGPDANLIIGEKRPSVMSHPYYASCTQCHVPKNGLRYQTEKKRLEVVSEFEGQESYGPGSRAFKGAPPTTPHPVFMRQNCMSCHGPSRPNAIRSSHPQRQNCLQCHAPDADYDNRERVSQQPPVIDP